MCLQGCRKVKWVGPGESQWSPKSTFDGGGGGGEGELRFGGCPIEGIPLFWVIFTIIYWHIFMYVSSQ